MLLQIRRCASAVRQKPDGPMQISDEQETTINEECIITYDTPEYKALAEAMRYAAQTVDKLIAGLNRPYWANAT